MPVNRLSRIAIGTGVLVLGAALVVVWKFPFRREAMVRRVEAAAGARVEMWRYRETWFPPGFTAERVRLSDPKGNVATIDAIALKGSYTGLLRSPTVISSLHVKGLRLVIPSGKAFPAPKGSGSGVVVNEIRLENAALDLLPETKFLIHSLVLNNVGKHEAVGFQVSLHNPAPPGEIRSHGQVGPIDTGDPGRTPVSGA
ncbi:MAG: hypothetical protein QOJ99_6147, partial [Bryobacterales bacterium]|nr:hypothetical protein [Bryobacterales bacterium]